MRIRHREWSEVGSHRRVRGRFQKEPPPRTPRRGLYSWHNQQDKVWWYVRWGVRTRGRGNRQPVMKQRASDLTPRWRGGMGGFQGVPWSVFVLRYCSAYWVQDTQVCTGSQGAGRSWWDQRQGSQPGGHRVTCAVRACGTWHPHLHLTQDESGRPDLCSTTGRFGEDPRV